MSTLNRRFTTADNRVMSQKWQISDFAVRQDNQILAFVYGVENMKYIAVYHRKSQPGRDDTLFQLGSGKEVVQRFLTRPLVSRIINDLIWAQGAGSAEEIMNKIVTTAEGYYVVGKPGRYSPVLNGRIYSRELRN